MSRITRRQALGWGAAAAGLVAGGNMPVLWAAEPASPMPDRSAKAPSLPVAIQRCESYEPEVVRRQLQAAIDLIGGIRELVANKTVTMKYNCTGGPTGTIGGRPPHLTYHVHPNVVAGLCAIFADAGAKRIVLVESQYSHKTPEEVLGPAGWDIAAIKSAGNHRVTFEDTRSRGQHPQYSRLPVAWGGFIFPAFDVHPAYEKTDVFVSLAKMKDHGQAGVTMTAKNLFGMPPTSLYGNDSPNELSLTNRMDTFHEGTRKVPPGVPVERDHGMPAKWAVRVPRITADCVGARPVDLAIIDGVLTNRGGEGPWLHGTEPIEPKLLLAGRNAVSTDAVCAAVMGYDPQADHGQFPFQGENHLKLLASVGVGTIDPARIDVRGLPIQQALHPFNPRHLPVPPREVQTRCGAARAYYA